MPIINSEFSTVIRKSDTSQNTIEDYLCNRFTYHSRAEWKNLIRQNLVKINQTCAGVEDEVRPGDKITFYVKDYHEPDVPLHYKVLYDNSGLMFVHKPSGLPVMKTGKIFFNTLINLLRRDLENPQIHLLNRLDMS